MRDVNAVRLVTTSDFDGWVCAILCRERRIASEIVFCDPYSDLESTGDNDIVANLGVATKAYLVFDRARFVGSDLDDQVCIIQDCSVPSTARVVYRFFGGRSAFPEVSQELMAAVDDIASAVFTTDEVLNPQGWHLLSAIMDSKTIWFEPGAYSTSKSDWLLQLMNHGRLGNVNAILELPLVQERSDLFRRQQEVALEHLRQRAIPYGNLGIFDWRSLGETLTSSRFAVDAILPTTNCCLQLFLSECGSKTRVVVRNSALHSGEGVNLNEWAGRVGGAVRRGEAWVSVDHQDADRVVSDAIWSITGKKMHEYATDHVVLAAHTQGDTVASETMGSFSHASGFTYSAT